MSVIPFPRRPEAVVPRTSAPWAECRRTHAQPLGAVGGQVERRRAGGVPLLPHRLAQDLIGQRLCHHVAGAVRREDRREVRRAQPSCSQRPSQSVRAALSQSGAGRTADARVAQDLGPRARGRVRVLGAEDEEVPVPRVRKDEPRPVLRDRLLRRRVGLLPRCTVIRQGKIDGRGAGGDPLT